MFFKELRNIINFFSLPKNKREIVFYSEHKGYYPSFEGVLNELSSSSSYHVCYITSDSDDPVLKEKKDKINTFYINKLLPFFMLIINCKIFVMTLTDLDNFYLKRSINNVKYVYLFHALVSSHMMYHDSAFDNYDVILCVGPHHEKEIRKREDLLGLRKKKLIPAGYYRLERITETFNKKVGNVVSNVKTILIAPSWGDHNIVESCGLKLTKNLLEAGYKVILRPHSETVLRKPAILNKYFDQFAYSDKFVLETNVSGDNSMIEADLLITDLSGIALEYAFGTCRPVLFIDLPKKIKNKKYNNLGMEPIEISLRDKIGLVIQVDQIDEISIFVEDLILSKDFYKDKLSQLKNEYIYSFGFSSKIGANAILEILREF